MKMIHTNNLFALAAAGVLVFTSFGAIAPEADAAMFKGKSELTFDTTNTNGTYNQFNERGVYLGQNPSPRYTIEDVTQSLYGNYRSDVNAEKAFVLGEVTHWNGKTVEGTEPDSLTYAVNYDFKDKKTPDQTFTFTVNYDAGTTGESDTYFIDGVLTSNETFEFKGNTYALQLLGFGTNKNNVDTSFTTGGLYSNTDTNVYGQFVEVSAAVPTPTAASLGLISLAALAFRRRKRSS
ncbi:choice-of-anchor K domain-containing protein [Poriferisphaera sp. WC338]|uniref:choice-of-anchor K domain-containing protein n=1 Tax=Poriferisphaera sp. WC338 TaxID=3425129 RepID=UPI003D812F15